MITATFNIRGSQPNVQQLFDLFDLEVLVLTETWAERQQVPTNLHAAYVAGISSPNRARLGGGV